MGTPAKFCISIGGEAFWLFSFFALRSASPLLREGSSKGKVTSATEGPLPGVIYTPGYYCWDNDWYRWELQYYSTNEQSVLVYSFISYTTQFVTVGNQTTIDIVLALQVSALNEVVVTGYGTQRKKDITGAVSNIKSDDFNKGAISNASQLIAGKAAGVMSQTVAVTPVQILLSVSAVILP